MIAKPHIEDVNNYFSSYIDQVRETDLMLALENNLKTTVDFFESIPFEKEDYAYDVDKYSIKEVFIHLLDTERIVAYRALRFGRKDATDLAGYEDEQYVSTSNVKTRTLTDLIEEFKSVRQSTIFLFRHLSDESLDFKGRANKNETSARICGWVIVGHTIHHCKVISERYLD